jgi:hypothetical protein
MEMLPRRTSHGSHAYIMMEHKEVLDKTTWVGEWNKERKRERWFLRK